MSVFTKKKLMKKMLFSVAAVMAVHTSHACDMCGNTSSSQYIGLLPALRRNFVGVQYVSSSQSGFYTKGLIDLSKERTTDYYNTIKLWGRQRIGAKYMAFVFVPYHINVRNSIGARTVYSGLGDVSVTLNRIIVNGDRGVVKHTLFAGLGLKLPTGNSKKSDSRSLPNVVPGSGTWDALSNVNYTVRRGKMGVNTDLSVVFPSSAGDGYRSGCRFVTGLTGFYTLNLKGFRFIPQLGLRHDLAGRDYFNIQKGWINNNSGGTVLYSSAGLQFAWRSIGFRANYLSSTKQWLNDNTVTVGDSYSVDLFLIF